MWQRGMQGRTAGQKMRLPLSEHGADLGREVAVELVGEDVLDATFREQVLSREMAESLLTTWKEPVGMLTKAARWRALPRLRYLLDAQTQVEDAVGAVLLAVGTSHLLDEAGQSQAELSRVALEDVFFDGHWWSGSE